ncbi:STAS-like domain-containing protein [Rhizobium leguminosarum]|uniref:STAS-like domain-containing protein n=1 Tax=Rhizobium leguminosarum TaxID=384 RepID=UPI0010321BAD|nr:STAS-like domain-containing protein [Rhizobium leguminosarum]TAV53079.1 DUF4325 domain-containing protein [Rhizobium leguminosarum]
MKTTKIPIAALVGGGVCVSASDGQKVYKVVQQAVAEGDRVILSFSGITRMTTAFLNAAIGQLYGEFSEEEVRQRLAPPVDFEPWHLSRLKLVVDRAKEFFKDGDRVKKAFEDNAGPRHAEDI